MSCRGFAFSGQPRQQGRKVRGAASPTPLLTATRAAVVSDGGGGMRLAVTLLGLDLLTIDLTTGDGDNGSDPGDCTSFPIGFTASPGDQRWERSAELE